MKKIIIALLVFASGAVYAQQDLTLYNMRYLHQASFTNPAFFPECKVNVGIPALSGTHIRLGNSGFVYKDFVELQSDKSLTLTPIKALGAMKDLNYLDQEFRSDIIHFGFRLKQKNYVSLNISVREQFRLSYPQDIFTLGICWQRFDASPGWMPILTINNSGLRLARRAGRFGWIWNRHECLY